MPRKILLAEPADDDFKDSLLDAFPNYHRFYEQLLPLVFRIAFWKDHKHGNVIKVAGNYRLKEFFERRCIPVMIATRVGDGGTFYYCTSRGLPRLPVLSELQGFLQVRGDTWERP